jgi:cytochrome c oxidase cbb3-type subunit 2
MPSYPWLERTELDAKSIAQDLKVQATLGVPYSEEMLKKAESDIRTQANADDPNTTDLAKRYPNAQSRNFDANPQKVTEADALIAYLQMLGTQVDFKLYDNKANVR